MSNTLPPIRGVILRSGDVYVPVAASPPTAVRRPPHRRGFHSAAGGAEAAEHMANVARGILIARLDDAAAGGLLFEILNDIEPALEQCGYDRHDVLRAIQEALFPEEFLPPSKSLQGLVPKRGGRAIGPERYAALIARMRRPTAALAC